MNQLVKCKNPFTGWLFRYFFFLGALAAYGFAAIGAKYFFLGLCAIALFFFILGNHRLRRQVPLALADKAISMDPGASDGTLYAIYDDFNRSVRKNEALRLVYFAGFFAAWVLIVWFGGADRQFLRVGFFIFVPALLIVAALMLLFSFLPRKKHRKVPALESYLADPAQKAAMLARHGLPDLREQLQPVEIDVTDTLPSLADACAFSSKRHFNARLPRQRNWIIISFTAIIPLSLLNILFIVCTILYAGKPAGRPALVVCFFLLILLIDPLFFGFCKAIGLFRKQRRGSPANSDHRSIRKERIVSVLPSRLDASVLEICLSESGTFCWTGKAREVERLRACQSCNAAVLRADNDIDAVFFLTGKADQDATAEIAKCKTSASAASTVSSDGAAKEDPVHSMIVQILASGRLPTEQELQKAANLRASAMDPLKKQLLQKMRQEALALYAKSSSTREDRRRLQTLQFAEYSALKGDSAYSDLLNAESTLMQKDGLTREGIRSMQRNPFVPKLWARIGSVVAVIAIMIILIASAKLSSFKLLQIGVSSVSGVVSLTIAEKILEASRNVRYFRKLKKAYDDPGFWENLVDIRAYKLARK